MAEKNSEINNKNDLFFLFFAKTDASYIIYFNIPL
jgi:hypothetical protein